MENENWIKNKMWTNDKVLLQNKFSKDFYSIIQEIFQIFVWSKKEFCEFSIDTIKKVYEKLRESVKVQKTLIKIIDKSNIATLRKLFIKIHIYSILNLVCNTNDFNSDNILHEFWKTQYCGYELAIQKNADYNDSYREHGFMGVLVRFGDKVKRLIHINSNKKKINFEALEDTFQDLANYCIMAIFLLDEEEDIENEIINDSKNMLWTCNYCNVNSHDLYSNKKDVQGNTFRVLNCPVLKNVNKNLSCNYCKGIGHSIYYRFGNKYKNSDDKKLYTCPKLINKMTGFKNQPFTDYNYINYKFQNITF